MTETELPAVAGGAFESLKRTNAHGAEYWSARDLQPLLGYSQWRRFEQAISRAIASCEQSGNAAENHFAGAGKMASLKEATPKLELDDRDAIGLLGDAKDESEKV